MSQACLACPLPSHYSATLRVFLLNIIGNHSDLEFHCFFHKWYTGTFSFSFLYSTTPQLFHILQKELGELLSGHKNYELYNGVHVQACQHYQYSICIQVIFLCNSQAQCGSSYAFSAVGALEGAVALAHEHLVPLSEQNVVDCSGKSIRQFVLQAIIPKRLHNVAVATGF